MHEIIKRGLDVLQVREFISAATSDENSKPNAAPKFLLKIEGIDVYFVDYSIGRTAENLKVNPRIAFSLMDLPSLTGYKLAGDVEVIDGGPVFDACVKELREKEIKLTVERIVRGVQKGQAQKDVEFGLPAKLLVYRVHITEGSEITLKGEIREIGG